MSKSLPNPVNRQSSTSAGHSWAPINSSISELLQPPDLWSLTKKCCTHYKVQRVYAVLYRLRKNQETCRSKPSVVVVSCLWANLTLLSEQVYHDLYNFFQNLVWRGFPFNHPCTEAHMKLNQRKNAALNHGSFMQLSCILRIPLAVWKKTFGWKIQKSIGDVHQLWPQMFPQKEGCTSVLWNFGNISKFS